MYPFSLASTREENKGTHFSMMKVYVTAQKEEEKVVVTPARTHTHAHTHIRHIIYIQHGTASAEIGQVGSSRTSALCVKNGRKKCGKINGLGSQKKNVHKGNPSGYARVLRCVRACGK